MPDIERVTTESDRAGGFVVRIERRLSPGALTEVVIRLDNADNVYVTASYHGETILNTSASPAARNAKQKRADSHSINETGGHTLSPAHCVKCEQLYGQCTECHAAGDAPHAETCSYAYLNLMRPKEQAEPYRVIVFAQNKRPKVVEFPNGARTGVFHSGLVVVSNKDTAHKVPNSRHITASEWDKKGLTPYELLQAQALALTL